MPYSYCHCWVANDASPVEVFTCDNVFALYLATEATTISTPYFLPIPDELGDIAGFNAVTGGRIRAPLIMPGAKL
jgi:hypothetical protein